MANTKNLDGALREVLSEIRQGLSEIIKKSATEEIETFRKAKGLHKLIEKKEQVEMEKDNLDSAWQKKNRELDIRICDIKHEIERLDGTSDERLEGNPNLVLDLIGDSYRPTISQVQAVKKIAKTLAVKNYLNFLDIEKNTYMMYNLAVTAKEKRSIILSVQTRDWRSLGIDIPQLPYMEKFDIENGEIKVPNQPLIEAPKN